MLLAIFHPSLALQKPPALNVLLKSVPDAASTYYIHDIALLPEARSGGAASEVVRKLISHARRAHLPNVSLVAVNGSTRFWERNSFQTLEDPQVNEKLASYDEQAKYMVYRFS
ncbi:GNAT family N-acetyltransferase [Bradyrhizobium sp. CB1717]|uniref:GNAT family N-acetyltransferase n=1 Tax=Bradyrhizobium sp. CB1717 TaxID=3039154 RepID=UPI0024B24696|nr:GNAT family N-acetyltransferase [Bradyrhizobium sp. CB1717]WFU25588.1 GNAT family N-acetyltransferase [Bradyrhizobium sp. CB1717]